MITLLRDTRVPADDPSRYDAVVARRRKGDRRRTTVAAASLAVVAIAGTATALTWRSKPSTDPQSFLRATTSAGSAHVVGSVDFGGHKQTYVGDIDFAHDAARLTTVLGPEKLEVRSIGDDVYVRGLDLGLGGGGHAGKHWMHSSSDNSGNINAFDPGRILDTLRSENAALTPQGHQEIDGERTTDYLVSGAKGDEGEPFSDGKGHVFVGDDGLVRRMTYEQPTFDSNGSATRPGTTSATTVVDFSDYGRTIDIEAPPASDTYEEQDAFTGTTSLSGSGTSVEVTPQPMTGDTKARACQLIKDTLAKQTQVPQAKKDQLIKEFCGK